MGATAVDGAAGVVVGKAAGASSGRDGFLQGEDRYAKLSPRHAPGFDHIVVVMGENRSFGNLLGYLYDETNLPKGQTFDGLAFGEYFNETTDGQRVDAHVYTGPTD